MRRCTGVSGVVVLAAAVVVAARSETFSGHMLGHLATVAVAAPLVAWSLLATLRDRALAHPLIGNPMAASVFELVIVWSWHAPALHHAARSGGLAFAVEQASFLIAGLWLWSSSLAGISGRATAAALGGVGALLFTSMHMTLLGALLVLAPRVLYEHVTTLHDQQTGGVLMLVVGGSAYLLGGLAVLSQLLRLPSGQSTR